MGLMSLMVITIFIMCNRAILSGVALQTTFQIPSISASTTGAQHFPKPLSLTGNSQ